MVKPQMREYYRIGRCFQLCFEASLPPLGYESYRTRSLSAKVVQAVRAAPGKEITLKNAKGVTVSVDGKTGLITVSWNDH